MTQQRLPNGRFAKGNTISAQGGKARAQKLSPEELSAIGRKGYEAMVNKYFGGSEHLANEWLSKRGLWASDTCYRNAGHGIFDDPGPHPAHRNRNS